MDRDSRSPQRGIVLKFKKRRFDGGSEVALIKAFERQEARAQQSRLLIRTEPLSISPLSIPKDGGFAENRSKEPCEGPCESEITEVIKPEKEPVLSKNPYIEALCLGPLELCVGLLGIMTATLGIVTFGHLKNQDLAQQSRDVLQDCFKTIGKGMADTLAGPGKAVNLVFGRS